MGAPAVRNICVLAVMLALVAGCGSSKKATSTGGANGAANVTVPAVSEDRELAAEVPAAISQTGSINVGIDADYAPNEFLASDKHTVVGMDPELITAVARVLGLKANIVNEPQFGAIIKKVVSGALTVGASSITDTKEREEKVDFVTYLSVGQSMMSKASGPHLTSLNEVCTHRIGVEAGTLEETAYLYRVCSVTVKASRVWTSGSTSPRKRQMPRSWPAASKSTTPTRRSSNTRCSGTERRCGRAPRSRWNRMDSRSPRTAAWRS